MTMKYKVTTARKWNGDDAYSWAIFVKGQKEPVVSGLSRAELPYHRKLIEENNRPPGYVETSKVDLEAMLAEAGLTAADVRGSFNQVANYIGSDVIQCCIDNGEPPVCPRECVLDYLDFHGGAKGKKVIEFLRKLPGSFDDLEKYLDQLGVPKDWA